jgi:GxxExxY protein
MESTIRKKYENIPKHIEDAASAAVDSAFNVHKKVGPGHLEKIYEFFMEVELKKSGCNVKRQVRIPIVYDGIKYDEYIVVDILVDDCLILELKFIENMKPVNKYQLLSYLKLSGIRLGLLINFDEANIGDGITRIIN